MDRPKLTYESLDPGEIVAAATSPGCGAIASFVGTVRETPAGTDPSKRVVALEYEGHEAMASERIAAICEEASRRWDLAKAIAVHRLGHCTVTEPTVVVACSAPHRAEALDACRWIIDTIKETVPIFKKEVYADGSAWLGAGS